MKTVFADTFFFLAVLNPSDSAHKAALALSRQLTNPRVTTAWVLTEVADAMSEASNRAAFLEFFNFLKQNKFTTIVGASETLFDRGIEFYSKRPDKNWSLTDCISFVVMQDLEIDEALTGDHHFEQAGFRALLK